jgi:hypothetical protein
LFAQGCIQIEIRFGDDIIITSEFCERLGIMSGDADAVKVPRIAAVRWLTEMEERIVVWWSASDGGDGADGRRDRASCCSRSTSLRFGPSRAFSSRWV